MWKRALPGLLVLGVWASGQNQRKIPQAGGAAAPPECASGAMCFSGEVREGREFQKDMNADLVFVVRLPGGIDIVSRRSDASCKLSAWVANPPIRAHHATEIDAAYDWTAEQEVRTSPREFRFATSCEDYQKLYDLSQTDAQKYFAQLASLAKGQGRLWITGSKITHSHGSVSAKNGAIVRMRFHVEIRLPNPN